MQLHLADCKSGREGSFNEKPILPTLVPITPFRKGTRSPFQVNRLTLLGAKNASGVVALISPNISRVVPEMVAFLTRYGPITSTDGTVAAISKGVVGRASRGFHIVVAVTLSAMTTTVEPNEIVEIPDGEPAIWTVPFTALATIDEPVIAGVE